MGDVIDPLDVASELSQNYLNLALDAHQGREHEQPNMDGLGHRLCLDCDLVINDARVVAVDAVRCVDCQSVFEQELSIFN